MKVAEQLEIFGLDATKRLAEAGATTRAGKSKLLRQVEVAHDLMSSLPSPDDLAFLHSGLCQTCLPHSRPASNRAVWTRSSGRFNLTVNPGMIDERPAAARQRQPTLEEQEAMYVGVPYGSRARLIMLFLQSEGVKSRTVSLGPSLSAWLRSLGLPISGGPRGSIIAIREQSLRIARCSMTMQWSETEGGTERTMIADTRIVDGLELWQSASGAEWCGTVELSDRFFQQLRQHAVPLDKRGIAHLAGNSLGLDLYALLAYRLPKLRRDLHLRWDALQGQIGAAETQTFNLAYRIRAVMPDVAVAYPHARAEVTPHGLLLKPSPPAVPKTVVPGFRLVESSHANTD
jgi:hypothetical protein